MPPQLTTARVSQRVPVKGLTSKEALFAEIGHSFALLLAQLKNRLREICFDQAFRQEFPSILLDVE